MGEFWLGWMSQSVIEGDFGRAERAEAAAMLSQLGCLTLPPATLEKGHRGETLSPDELSMVNARPAVGASLVAHIPRLEEVAAIIKQ